MTIHDLQSWTTLVLILVFCGIVYWAYSKRRNKDFQEAANLPLNEPEQPRTMNQEHRGDYEQ